MSELRGLLWLTILAVVGSLVALVTEVPKPLPIPVSSQTSDWIRLPYEGVWTIACTFAENPRAFAIGACVLLVPYFVAAIASIVPRRVHKDPRRIFTAEQKRTASNRADNRCEMETVFYLRCRRDGSHADHWIPWSKGGSSGIDNLVHACAFHNLSKRDRMPTWGQSWRLEMRRRRYFPPGVSVRPGARFAR